MGPRAAQMKDAVRKAHHGIVNNIFTSSEAKVYLKTQGFNTSTQNEICKHAERVHLYNYTEEHQHESPATQQAFRVLTRLKEEKPSNFERWQDRSLWCRGFPLDLHIDAIMHLLFEPKKTNSYRICLLRKKFQKYYHIH